MRNHTDRFARHERNFNFIFRLAMGIIAFVFIAIVAVWITVGVGIYKAVNSIEHPSDVGRIIGEVVKGFKEVQ